MREFKFRFWDIKNNRFETNMGVTHDGYVSDLSECPWNYAGENGENYIIQQYTGLKDKNGKDIYEGDILRSYRMNHEPGYKNKYNWYDVIEIGQVLWIDLLTEFAVSYEHIRYDDIHNLGCASHRYEVIGNIFENPELL